MWLFLINPLKLCSYGSWSLQAYVCKSSCCQCLMSYNFAWILKCLKLYPFQWLMTLPQPLSHSAALPEWLMQPRSHSATLAGAATQPLSQQPLKHSAAVAGAALSHSARVVGAATTQPFCHTRYRSGWSSHSATLPHVPRSSHSATQPLCQSLEQPLRHSATPSLCRAATQPLSTQPLCQSGWCSHSATQPWAATQPLSWSSHSVTQSGWVAEWPLANAPP